MITALSFLQALQYPTDRLREALGGACPTFRENGGMPRLQRLTEFLEATVSVPGSRYRIAVPLHEEASSKAVRRAARLQALGSARISGFRLAEEALIRTDLLGNVCKEHLFVERIPDGRPLDEILLEGCSARLLHRELTAMQAEFYRRGFSHGNLKPGNLVLTPEGLIVATRCYQARFDGPSDEDDRAFEALHQLADLQDNSQLIDAIERGVEEEAYGGCTPEERCSEGLRPVMANGLYGFCDLTGRQVVAPRFDVVEPFCEGRAVVGRNGKYGVIDKSGRVIIPLRYEGIEYEVEKSHFYARINGRWILKDYCGENLSDACESKAELLFCRPEF